MNNISTWFKELPKWIKVLFVSIFVILCLFLNYLLLSSVLGYLDNYNPVNVDNDDISDVEEEEEIIEEEPESVLVEVEGLDIEIYSTPQKVNKVFDITIPSEYITEDIDSNFEVVYKTGRIKEGEVIQEEGSTDLSGYDIYLLSSKDEDFNFVYSIRIAYKSDSDLIFVLSSDIREPGVLFEESLNGNVLDISEYFVNTSNWVADDIFSSNILYKKEIGLSVVSDGGNKFRLPYSYINRPFVDEESNLIEIDSIDGEKVYNFKENLDGSSVVVSKEGFLQRVTYEPSIVQYINNDPIVSITLNNKKVTNYAYDYVSIGGCAENNLEVVDVKDSELESIGRGIDKSLIYVKKNKNDSYLKKIYQEDYIGMEMNKQNTISADDTKPYTYEQFISDNPILYWKDPFGRYIMFARRDYIMTGGCAKPAIYLYPERETKLNVSVIPNGFLTYTYPKYGNNGWDVTANSDGSIKYKDELYSYLWWDSISYGYSTPSKGWVIKRSEFEDFIDANLRDMNLNENEIRDFKEFWVPVINKEDSKYIFISFLFNSDVDQIARLDFSVKPDNIFRVFMVYESLNEYRDVKPLNIQRADRDGFTVIEWGGAKER